MLLLKLSKEQLLLQLLLLLQSQQFLLQLLLPDSWVHRGHIGSGIHPQIHWAAVGVARILHHHGKNRLQVHSWKLEREFMIAVEQSATKSAEIMAYMCMFVYP